MQDGLAVIEGCFRANELGHGFCSVRWFNIINFIKRCKECSNIWGLFWEKSYPQSIHIRPRGCIFWLYLPLLPMSTSISQFSRDSGGDLQTQDIRLTVGGDLAVVTGVEEAGERVMAGLRFRLGEDKWTPDYGLDYKLIFSRPVTDQSLLIALLESYILDEPDVDRANIDSFEIDRETRALAMTVLLGTTFGESTLEV